MEPLHVPPALRPQRHHAAIADARGLSIEGLAYPERILHGTLLLVESPADPAGPAGLALGRRIATPEPKDAERRVVELSGALEIVRPQANVREHRSHGPSSIRTSAIQLR